MVALTLFEKSGYSLKYRVTNDDNDGGGGFAEVTQAQMLDHFGNAPAVAGPLRALLTRTFTDAQWAHLVGNATPGGDGQKNAPLSLHVSPEPNPDVNSAPAIGAILDSNEGTHRLFVTCGAAGAPSVSGIIEIRFHHSEVR